MLTTRYTTKRKAIALESAQSGFAKTTISRKKRVFLQGSCRDLTADIASD
jgi:hypothetical protein